MISKQWQHFGIFCNAGYIVPFSSFCSFSLLFSSSNSVQHLFFVCLPIPGCVCLFLLLCIVCLPSLIVICVRCGYWSPMEMVTPSVSGNPSLLLHFIWINWEKLLKIDLKTLYSLRKKIFLENNTKMRRTFWNKTNVLCHSIFFLFFAIF